MGILVPREHGGSGLDHLAFTICVEELARACASTSVIVDVHNSVASEPILLFGTDEQRRSWLPRLASGEVLGAFALTEPGSGSDAASLRTTARRVGGEWVLTGRKVFITNIGEAGLYVVFARTGAAPGAAGVSAFLVPADSDGVRVGQVFRKLGLNGSPTGELVLEEARVAAANLLHVEGRGFSVAMRALDSGRIGISGQALGIAGAALAEALEHKGRQADGEQGDAFTLADMATRLVAGRQMAYHAAVRCTEGRSFTREASMAKLFCTDAAMDIAGDALRLVGPPGALSGQPLERHFRDAKALQIYEGTNQVQRVVIARRLLQAL
jgi:alkylation response protein AidB-like acyl-CoA dehydrogenase